MSCSVGGLLRRKSSILSVFSVWSVVKKNVRLLTDERLTSPHRDRTSPDFSPGKMGTKSRNLADLPKQIHYLERDKPFPDRMSHDAQQWALCCVAAG